MDEFQVKNELSEKRKNIKSFDDLVNFLNDVKTNYNIGYGAAPRAIAQASLAVAWFLTGEFGITSFQAGFVMWDFIQDWMFSSNKCGLKIVDYDNMLYPQYDHKFEKTISSETWMRIRKEAREKLKDTDYVHPDVIEHWRSVANGRVPFGYSVKDD